MPSGEIYLGQVYENTVALTKAAIEAGKLDDAQSVLDFIDAVHAKLKDLRGSAVPYDEFAKYD